MLYGAWIQLLKQLDKMVSSQAYRSLSNAVKIFSNKQQQQWEETRKHIFWRCACGSNFFEETQKCSPILNFYEEYNHVECMPA